jgi:CDP-diacylglycerol--serine O-phosphatidyltransferase
MSDPDSRQRFSLLRTFALADFITLGNAACGTAAIFMCLQHVEHPDSRYLIAAFILLPLAFILDALDGMVARKTGRSSPLGGDLDSLADTISFGVAPAALAFTLGMRGGWDTAILVYFVCCGVGRLARFNVTAEELSDETTGKVKYFEGTPIPTSLLLVAVLGWAYAVDAVGASLWLGEVRMGMLLHPLTLLFAVSGTLMISTVRIPKL